MTDEIDPEADPATARAAEWLVLVHGGEARQSDHDALLRWRREDPANDAAYRRVEATGLAMKSVGRRYRERQLARSDIVLPFARRAGTRRAFLGTAAAASAAGILVAARSLDLLPGPDRKPDYQTAIGERRSLALARGVTVDLDARSSFILDRADAGVRIGLQGGRAEIRAAIDGAPLLVSLGRGMVAARRSRFDVELFDDHACVTCITGALALEHPLGTRTLAGGERVTFSDDDLATPVAIDVAEAGAWKRGWLIYRGVPLARVIADVGRYRHGRIILADAALARKPVTGTFQVDRIEAAIDQIAQLTATRRIALPGGTLILV